MKVLIIGASSYVGARIYFDLKNKYEIVGTYNTNPLSKSFVKLNITNKDEVIKTFKEIKPNVIIHVANFPSPRNAINNEDNFKKLNDEATKFIVEGANETEAKLIFISSQAANNATDLYGQLKAKSEELVKNVKAGYLVIRPSYIIGFSPNVTNPRPFNRILKCFDNKTIGEFDTSWKLQPTYLGHISQIIEKTIDNNIWNTVIPVFIDEIVTQYQIALDVLGRFGLSVKQTDQHIDIPPSKDRLKIFHSFNLNPHTYKEMIEKVITEIRNKDKFKIK